MRAFSAATALALLAGSAGALLLMTPLAFAVGPVVTTDAATGITSSNATLNGTNGDTDATGHSFWVSTSTFTPTVDPVSLPSGVYSTADLGPVTASTTFSANLSDAVGLTVTASTTYYFTAYSNGGGSWTPGSVLNFTTLPNAPAVTGVNPTTGTTTGGTSVTITGSNFTGATGVAFGTTSATGVVVNSDTSITAVSPSGTGVVDVTVTTSGGTSATSSADQFTYVAPTPAPTVTAISPTSGPTTGGTTVTITGTDLTGATAVTFGSTPATGVVVASSTSLTAISPAGSAGTVDVTVTTPGGTSATSSADQFTYTAVAPLAPAISGIAVSGISSTTATITWTTDLPASTQVAYGLTSSYGSTSAYNGTASTTHSVTLTGLSEGTLYHFAAKSGNITATTTSSDNTFVTLSTASSTPLHVDSTTAVQTSATADGLFSSGWIWVMHLTVPDNEDAFRMSFTDWTGSSGTFQADNNVRISSAQSSNASTPATGIISPDNGYSAWMYLTGDTSTTTPGRQIDVEIDVRIPVGTAPGSYSTTFNANSVPQAATSTSI